jgi:hypothetical protein
MKITITQTQSGRLNKSIKRHLVGTKQEYAVLRVTRGDKVIAVHTGKVAYINKVASEY